MYTTANNAEILNQRSFAHVSYFAHFINRTITPPIRLIHRIKSLPCNEEEGPVANPEAVQGFA